MSYLPTNPSLSDFIYRCPNLPRQQLGQQSESGRQVDVEVPRDNGRRRTNEVGARFPPSMRMRAPLRTRDGSSATPLTVDPPDCFSH